MQTIPSGINNSYLWYRCQGLQRQEFFKQTVKIPEYIKQTILGYKAQRETVIKTLVEYARGSIENM